MYFKYLYQEGVINLNPMVLIDMTKEANYLAAQGKEDEAQRGVKEVHVRENMENQGRLEAQVGKRKSATSKCDIPLNNTAIEMIRLLQEEVYLGEDAPIIPDENGNFTNPRNMRNRFYRILDAAGVERKGLHSLRHTFATNLINGIKQPDGTIKSLPVRLVNLLLSRFT